MKMKLLSVPTLMAVMSALVVINSGEKIKPADGPTTSWTTEPPVLNLNGKMFTLSRDKGGISFYDPYYFSPRSTTTKPHTPITGVSVCVRYIADYPSLDNYTVFTLSPSITPLKLQISDSGRYKLSFDWSRNYLSFRPNLRFWPNIAQDIWNRVCVTVDSIKNVAQVFTGSSMSVRKKLLTWYKWSGEPLIELPGFDGQVTDIQMWNYPICYREILNYMSSCVYGPCSGSALSWSHISYSSRGDPLLEDTYERQAKEPISSRGGGRRPKGEKKKSLSTVGKVQEKETTALRKHTRAYV